MIVKSTIVYKSLKDFGVRESSYVVKKAKDFQSDISIKIGDIQVNAKNLYKLNSLPISPDSKVEVIANGEDENQAVKTICDIMQNFK